MANAVLPRFAREREYDATLRELAQRPQVFVNGSEIVRRIDGRVPLNLSAYKPALDQIWDVLGITVLFSSVWPNSDTVASYDLFNLAQSYIETRTTNAQPEVFLGKFAKGLSQRSRELLNSDCTETPEHPHLIRSP